MDELILKYYYSPDTGFSSAVKIRQKMKADGHDVTLKQVKEVLAEQEVVRVIKPIVKPKEYNTIRAGYPLENVQMDIMVYDRFTFNHYNNVLCLVDVYSRYAMCRAMTNRKIENIIKQCDDIFKETGYPKSINCDNEFDTHDFNDWAKRHGIEMKYSQPYEVNKNAIVERFNRTLAELLQKWRTATKRYDWANVLPQIVKSYNQNIHSTIQAVPEEVFEGKAFNNQVPVEVPNRFKVGEKVRIQNERGSFAKGDVLKYNKTIYTIRKIEGNKIYVTNEDGTEIKKFFKPYEVMKVKKVQTFEAKDDEEEKVHQKTQQTRKHNQVLKSVGIDQGNMVTGKRVRRARDVLDL
jgi:transposase InsO family protein